MWFEKLFDKLASLNYIISSFIIPITIFSIYMFFTTKVNFLPLDFHTFLETSSLSILIGYQLAGIKYFINNIISTFIELKPIFKYDRFQTYFDNLDQKLQNSVIYYFTIILIVIPFILLVQVLLIIIEFGELPRYIPVLMLSVQVLLIILVVPSASRFI